MIEFNNIIIPFINFDNIENFNMADNVSGKRTKEMFL